eukprot:TRINITY_DN1130_c0_g1_i1.p1 TRINITY_DN1130_c0_g1~~TRINITY_DN1130_c0_g1_i1.p1  ORF type:complete len:430 (+),score=59.01 TRINITY_DN1130_c0_g1_i1:303-1592(+)
MQELDSHQSLVETKAGKKEIDQSIMATQQQQEQSLPWKFRWENNSSVSEKEKEKEKEREKENVSSSDSDTCASSHASGWEAASSSAPSPITRRHISRSSASRRGPFPSSGFIRRGRFAFGSGRYSSSSSSGAEDNNERRREMSSASSEILFQRRSRAGRVSSDFAGGLSETSRRPRSGAQHHHHHHHRIPRRSNHYDPDYQNYYHCHGSLRVRNFLHRVSETDRESNLSEHTSSSSMFNEETNRNQNRMNIFSAHPIENNNLHGAVMQQARNHFYERLRASSLARNRLNRTDSTSAEFAFYVRGLSLSDVGSLEVGGDRERVTLRNGWFDEEVQGGLISLSEPKPQGLSQKGINGLPKEVFVPKSSNGNKNSTEGNSSLEQEDCPVCLENFLPGEQLTRLVCRHRFHPICLNPWLRICGDCPYCRANVL